MIKATSIVRRLFDEGYIAYFAGGWVRDFLLGFESDEIDIATSAPPDKIMELFPKSLPIGLSFGVVIVVIEGKNYEITTFRKDHPYLDGRHPVGIDFSTPEKDALRRDFTINGMFYDPLTKTLHDYVGGQVDLKNKIIRAIGEPLHRFEEDKLRMLRAIRFSIRFHFEIEKKTKEAIHKLAHTLFPSVSMERVWNEFTKMSNYPNFDQALVLMHHLNLLQTIFPELKKFGESEIKKRVHFFNTFPKNTPTILYLCHLFPGSSQEEIEELCHYLKTKKTDLKLALFFFHSETLFAKKEIDNATWAHFYAKPFAPLFIDLFGAKLPTPQKELFFEEHKKREQALFSHVERIIHRRPLLSAARLQEEGIAPGKKLGLLLKEGEKISINEDLHDPEEVLKRLKRDISDDAK